MLQLLTQSRIKVFRQCPRKHYYRYLLCRRPHQLSPAVYFGTLIHVGLEVWWQNCEEAPADRLHAALAAIQLVWSRDEDPDEYLLVRLREVMRGYHARWIDVPYEVIAVEKELGASLSNPATKGNSRTYRLAGKLDAIVSDGLDKVWVLEHKSTSQDISPGSDYWRRLTLDPQISMYIELARLNGYAVQGCIYDVLRRPTLSPKKATPTGKKKYRKDGTLYANQREEDETPDEYGARLIDDIAERPGDYYQRSTIVRFDQEMREHRYDVWQVASQMRDNTYAEIHPRNPEQCIQYSRACEYMPVCCGEASIEDDHLYQTEDQHSELEELTK